MCVCVFFNITLEIFLDGKKNVRDGHEVFSLYLLTISQRLSRFPRGNLEPNVHTSPLRRDGNAHAFLSMEYIIFSSFFVFSSCYYFYVSLLSLYFSLSVCIVCITFGQQNCNNGSVLLHKYVHRNMPQFVRRGHYKCFIIYFTVW